MATTDPLVAGSAAPTGPVASFPSVGASHFVGDGECAFTEVWLRDLSVFCRAPSAYLMERPGSGFIFPVCVDHAAWSRVHPEAPERVARIYLAPVGSSSAVPT